MARRLKTETAIMVQYIVCKFKERKHKNNERGKKLREGVIRWDIRYISERGYNPETPSNFWNNPKDSAIEWHAHLS